MTPSSTKNEQEVKRDKEDLSLSLDADEQRTKGDTEKEEIFKYP